MPDRNEEIDGLGKAPLWLPLDALEAARLFHHLAESEDPILRAVRGKMEIGLSNTGEDAAFRAAAVAKYVGKLPDGDLDFQPDGMVSKSDEGAYVQAFLWVRNAGAGLVEAPEEDAGAPGF